LVTAGRKWLAAAAAALLVLGLATNVGAGQAGGPASHRSESAARAGGSFSMFAFSFSLNHLSTMNSDNFQLTTLLYTPLFVIDPLTGKVKPAMAQSWKTSDERNWTITIKRGWKFHNGQEVTAQSFADSWNASAYAPNAFAANFYTSIFSGYNALNPTSGTPARKTLSGVQVAGRYKLRIKTTRPLSLFPYLLANPQLSPIPRSALQNLAAYDTHPVGNGPYELQSFSPGQSATVRRFAGYKGKPGKAATITLKVYTSQQAAYTDFLAGNLDIVYPPPATVVPDAQKSLPGQFAYSKLPLIDYVGLPTYVAQFHDVRVRQALSMAIDRRTISQSLLQGVGTPSTAIFSPQTIVGSVAGSCAACAFNVTKAKQLLAAAGGWRGPLTLTYSTTAAVQVVQAVANMWHANLGIDVQLQALPSSQLAQLEAGDKLTGAYYGGLGLFYPHIENALDLWFRPTGAVNFERYSNPNVIRLIDRGYRSSQNKALTFYEQAAALALKDMPVIPIYNKRFAVVWSKRIGNFGGGVQGTADLSQVVVK
jgi:oligopeptide transport system substrate-binding protein